jgi:hypothetical protein
VLGGGFIARTLGCETGNTIHVREPRGEPQVCSTMPTLNMNNRVASK